MASESNVACKDQTKLYYWMVLDPLSSFCIIWHQNQKKLLTDNFVTKIWIPDNKCSLWKNIFWIVFCFQLFTVKLTKILMCTYIVLLFQQIQIGVWKNQNRVKKFQHWFQRNFILETKWWLLGFWLCGW